MFKQNGMAVVNFRGIEMDKIDAQSSSGAASWLRGILLSLGLFTALALAVIMAGR